MTTATTNASEPALFRLRDFVTAFSKLLDSKPDEKTILREGSFLLKELVRIDDWLPEACGEAGPDSYRQYLLHADSSERFSVVSFVFGAGQTTPIHNHTVWGLIGMLRGSEIERHYRKNGAKLVEDGKPHRLHPGEVDSVSPTLGDLHRVSNASGDRASVSIHVYGANIGAVERSVFELNGAKKPFISGYSNRELPNLWDRSKDPRRDGAKGSKTVVWPSGIAVKSASEIRADLLARREIGLLDVREEAIHAEGHPLFAANLPLSRLEMEVFARVPRLATPIVVFDNGKGMANRAAMLLAELGYTDVMSLDGGLNAWRNAGYELFRDVNAPSKAFGELVESQRHTPSLSAQEVKALIDSSADFVIVDTRRFDEFQNMSIPTATSVPGAELVLRMGSLAPNLGTQIIVNCAGRTRGIIGTQSLINAGFPRVAALRNGTIGWKLAGHALDRGNSRKFAEPNEKRRLDAAVAARRVADRAGVQRIDFEILQRWIDKGERTVYRFDVRNSEEYAAGHIPGFRNVPGGQLVQETEMYASVRGAVIVLADDLLVRADMTASWLRQMNWEVCVLEHLISEDGNPRARFSERGEWRNPLPPLPELPRSAHVSAETLKAWLDGPAGGVSVLDFAPSALYAREHVPGACFTLRSQLREALATLTATRGFVLTSPDGVAARFAYTEASGLATAPVFILEGGTHSWGLHYALSNEEAKYASPPVDRYKRPYEGTDVPESAMQAYLDWEFGLVEQLRRDGTHGFFVI